MAEGNVDSTDGLDVLFNKMKTDLMYELRNIQHGEKPVTGQDNKEKINKFLTRYTTNDAKEVPHPADDEDHRPETVVMEVQGIIESKPVTSVLQSAAFRRQLENVIRGSIGSGQRSPISFNRNGASRGGATPNNTQRQGRLTPPRNPERRSLNNQAGSSREAAPDTFPVPVPRPRTSLARTDTETARPQVTRTLPTLTRSDSTDSISSNDSFSSARSSADLDEDFEDVEEPLTLNQTGAPNRNTNGFIDTSNQEPRVLSNVSEQDIRAAQREELVEEISELLHHRLVSSTLDSQFRARLELHIQDRISASGTNGAQVQNFIQSLPPSGIVRNDFSDLGIPNPQDFDNLDTVSVTNVSTHSIPFTSSNTHMSREIQSLKSQMAEMKNMLKLTFDLQMDIQRAIRQEVAAAMTQVAGATAGASPVRSVPVSDTHCLICLERHSDSVLYQCGHMCVCYVCGRDLVSRNLTCPVCRAPIKDVIRAYKTNAE